MSKYLPDVIKGDADYRTYRPILLDNGITVLLANDPQSKHFAASVSVHAGASSDPRGLPGLAHFCEHMCFLGSKAYPKENEYKQFLAQHGGKSNASTSMSHTTYQFDILAEHGEKALDIFTNFFISPLFSSSGTQREVQAVDSENSKNLVSDGRRRWQVLKSIALESHHFSKFSTGNKITLPACVDDDEKSSDNSSSENKTAEKVDNHPLEEILKDTVGSYDKNDVAEFVRAALLQFHKRHYRPQKMTVVVIGPQSLDGLESWVVPRFCQIPDRWLMNEEESNSESKDDNSEDCDADSNKEEKWQAMQAAAAALVEESSSDAPPVSIKEVVKHSSSFHPKSQGGKWPVVLTTKPLQAVRTLVLFFPMAPTYNVPDRSPTSILSHLIGHEGPGSAFALLQDRGWISSLSSGNRISASDQCLFQIQMNLTKDGEEHWKEVVNVIFEYASMLRNAAEKEDESTCNELGRIWDECAALDRIRFHQTSPGAVYSFASSIAQSISKHGTETCLSAGSLLNESFPLKEVQKYIQDVTPQNCIIERCSQGAWEEMEALYNDAEENSISSSTDFSFGKQTEKWYGVDYYVSPIVDKDVQEWESKSEGETTLHLPTPNRYIPRTLDLCKDLPEEARVPRIEKHIDPPQLLVNSPKERLWHRLDDRYALPKASVTILLRTATAENELPSGGGLWEYSSEASMKNNFMTNIFADALAQETYDAYLAGLGFSLSKSPSGFTLRCSGYSANLSDFAIQLLSDFSDVDGQDFLKDSHFITTKDKIVRGLKSYFESRRADSLALYYSNLLLSSRGSGIEKNLELAEAMTLEDIKNQHISLWSDSNVILEVFYTGNVSQKDAESFFSRAQTIIKQTQSKVMKKSTVVPWVPGPFERRLIPGEELELHFQSKNPKEENGAVIVSYQSQVPGFRGRLLSSENNLKHTAAIRLLCKMIKEPCFNELRTKQQLGYIVSSYYDVNFSSRQSDFFANGSSELSPLSTSIDSLVIYVLSRKEKPLEVANRIEDFILNFRSKIADMSEEELQDYADSLAKALTKPIKKLGDEANNHFGKIRRYAPETLTDLPWDNAEVVAESIRNLSRDDVLAAYDSLVVKKSTRSKLTSFVYGKTFPMDTKPLPSWSDKVTATTLDELMTKRQSLLQYDPALNYQGSSGMWRLAAKHKTTMKYAVAAAAAVGVGIWAIKSRGDKKEQQ